VTIEIQTRSIAKLQKIITIGLPRHTLNLSFTFHSPHFSGLTVVTRSDAFGEVSFCVSDLLCRPDRIVIKRDLCRPIPVA